jgi:hypothetical protein
MRESFESWAASKGFNIDSWDMLMYDSSDTNTAWEGWQVAYKMQQAEIDRLMLEFCPGEMTQEQIDEWKKHQKCARDGYQK